VRNTAVEKYKEGGAEIAIPNGIAASTKLMS
jgi:hypothetical protein